MAKFDSTQPEVKSDTLCSLRQGGTCTQQLRKDEGGVVACHLIAWDIGSGGGGKLREGGEGWGERGVGT
jgi:hypothetical protein